MDTDQDGVADARILMFPMGAGFMHYFDFDADGILDAYFQLSVENGTRSARQAILVEESWIPVETQGDLLGEGPRIATSLASPPITYAFRDGMWRESD